MKTLTGVTTYKLLETGTAGIYAVLTSKVPLQ